MTDAGVMQSIMALASDPELMAAMKNPEVLRIIASGDLKAAERSPAFQRIANNPKIKALMQRVKGNLGRTPKR